MKILFLAIGKKHDPEIASAIDDFTLRISHYVPVEWKILPAEQDVGRESASILKAVQDRDHLVLLDETGKEITSVELANFMEKRLNASTQRLVFLIGGAFGVDEQVRNRADGIFSLSKLTFPHQLVRLILAEQIYRAMTIRKGEKYHHQ